MSELATIQDALTRAAQRRRWQRAWHGLWQGLLIGSLLWLIALATYKLAPIPGTILFGAAAAAGLALLIGFFYGWFHRATLQETARLVDRKENLQERLSTALELSATGTNENWRTLLITDAAQFAAKLDLHKLFPFHLPRVSRWALLLLALSAGLGFVPEYRSKEFQNKKADAAAIKEAGNKLLELTKHNLEHRPPALEPTRKTLETVEQLGVHMDQGQLTRSEALKDLSNVADKLKQQMKDLGQKNPEFKAMEKAAREANRGSSSLTPEAQKQLDALQKSLGKAGENPQALDQMKDELQKLQKAAANMPKDGSAEGTAARRQMTQALAELGKKAKDLGQQIPNLDEAINALKNNQVDSFMKDMQAATTDMEKMSEMAKTMQQLQEQAGHQGKDLPEQLKFGQAETAQQTLQKMIDQLKSGNVTPEEAKKMLDEVSRAVDPASPFGKAADFLKQAVGQMKSGEKSGAAESLASASKELQKTLDQLDDAKSLAASLDAVNKAEMAIATKKNWGQCPTCGDKSGKCMASGHCLKAGKGGKGGPGVGTWTDDNSQLYPEMSQLWDNSGLQRPDMASKGLTDRGDAQLADGLSPTKLQGQITPGGPMPSINLKGVSIKGQSTVSFQNAAATAQSEAQSALNQDQVPRAYQGAVRDYFDDLKK